MSWRKCRKKQNFSVPIKNDATNIDKDDGNESVVTIYYKTNYLLIVQDLENVHYLMLLII